jgi:ParB family chromosome partitioning protein
MKVESARVARSDRNPVPAEPASAPPATTVAKRTRAELAVAELVPDPENRMVDESAEEFDALVDSVRVLGVLVAVQVVRQDGRFLLIDGERRWRAARRVGLTMVPCDVWPDGTHRRDVVLAGVVMNEQRVPHSCLSIARRLRQVKNEFAETHEQVAARTGMPGGRVKAYLSLFNASDQLLEFLEEESVLLKTAVEFVRYERAEGEAASRRLLARYREEGLTFRDIEKLRKRGGARAASPVDEGRKERPSRTRGWASRLEAAWKRDAEAAVRELEALAARFGFRLMSVSQRD